VAFIPLDLAIYGAIHPKAFVLVKTIKLVARFGSDGIPFRLFYRGPLKSDGSKENKHEIRLAIHPQLLKLWSQERLKPFAEQLGYLTKKDPVLASIIYEVGDKDYACLITERLKIYAELDILFLRPTEPGHLITSGGDIDNRLKTLFDALQKPHNEQALPKGALLDRTPNPCHCLLSDDSLISRVSVTTDTLLDDVRSDDEVVLIITVTVMQSVATVGNMSYIH
jgi:hypothetical protein